MADDGRPPAAAWFSSDLDDPADQGPWGWRLDVVTLLAVIGESSIAEHSQTITASIFCLLPRIIPAPQAFLKPSRPVRLPETTAKMTGVYSGVTLDTVGFFANIIHPLDELQPFAFKVLEIKHTDRNNAGGVEVPRTLTERTRWWFNRRRHGSNSSTPTQGLATRRTLPRYNESPSDTPEKRRSDTPTATLFNSGTDVEAGAPKQGIVRQPTMKEKLQDFAANPTLVNTSARPAVPATLYSPLHILSIFSCLITLGIIGLAARYQDGTAIIAVSLVSFASSIVGWASWWRPILMNRSHTNKVPEGDVIIRTREGAFLLIKCTEEVARELYSGTEECQYHVSGQAYRVLMGLGTCLLMISVILLGNCKWYTQIFIGCSYIVLNGVYWAMGLLDKRYFWDLSRYDIKEITPPESKDAHTTTFADPREGVKSYTRTLWFAVRETQRTAWVHRSGAAPDTPQWRKWLAEAEQAAKNGTKNWPAVGRKDDIMKMMDGELTGSPIVKEPPQSRDYDAAEQAAPYTEVQPRDRRGNDGTL
ncbi:uncharacterized protein GGS22DRAFT_155674 [Annulohypoxylon maeteangense]|uniref:uncharacterized protein n=1 Tax=Annulohypoxylon maeteangense TaxID=1927788 RepID=UPI002008AAF2|nr:uncharacterized protein GGS22DRAFT_155674 [Annulohypoxylon maeteangense]KAI0888360.1 hypothetical protein GGS22DRAFT_155674 [Annulohypoxylon maeteangense]